MNESKFPILETKILDKNPFKTELFKQSFAFETIESLPNPLILETFCLLSQKIGFQSCQLENNQTLAFSQKKLSLFEIAKTLCLNCVKFSKWKVDNTVIFMKILNDREQKKKILKVYLLKGEIATFKIYTKQFKTMFQDKIAGQNPDNKEENELIEVEINKIIAQAQNEKHQKQQILTINPLILECSAYYQFSLIMSNENLEVGNIVIKGIKEINSESNKKIKIVNGLIEECVNSINIHCNSQNLFKELIPYCRVSVERFLFEKLYQVLYHSYIPQFNSTDSAFFLQRESLLSTKTLPEILRLLDVSRKFWLLPSDYLTEKDELKRPLTDSEMPYSQAIEEISKIDSTFSLRDKFTLMVSANTLMKTAVIEFYQGREELISMDDELPVVLWVLLKSRCEKPLTQICMVEDFICLQEEFDFEKKFIMNFKMAAKYIATEISKNQEKLIL